MFCLVCQLFGLKHLLVSLMFARFLCQVFLLYRNQICPCVLFCFCWVLMLWFCIFVSVDFFLIDIYFSLWYVKYRGEIQLILGRIITENYPAITQQSDETFHRMKIDNIKLESSIEETLQQLRNQFRLNDNWPLRILDLIRNGKFSRPSNFPILHSFLRLRTQERIKDQNVAANPNPS